MLRQCWHSHVWGIDAAYNLAVRGDWVEINQDQIPFGEVWMSSTAGTTQIQSPYIGWKEFKGPVNEYLAKKVDGTLWAWKATATANTLMSCVGGQCVPKQIPGSYIDYSVLGASNARILDNENNLFSWGCGGYVGDGTLTTRLSPIQIPGKWANLTKGYAVGGVKTDGTLWVWDDVTCANFHYLPDGVVSCGTPVKIPGGWCCASAPSGRVMFGIKANCSLFTWGRYDTYGLLGNGLCYSNQPSPTQIPGCWTCVISVYNGIYGIKHDCTMWAWGYNADISGAPASSPIQIPGTWTEFAQNDLSLTVIAKQTDGNWYGWRRAGSMFGLPTFCIPGKTCGTYFCAPTLLNPQFTSYYLTHQRTYYLNK